ncbi:MAG: hypothetical protein ABR905_14570 [Terracidiphilus sp.]
MTENPTTMSCQQFQAGLPELIGSNEDVAADPHLKQCLRCRSLLADLESIAMAARELFPVVEPPDNLWTQIETALRKEEGTGESEAVPG